MRPALFVVLATAVGCGPALTIYHKTSPRRVAVKKQSTAPALTARAHRRGADGLAIKLKRSRVVRLERVVHYNAAEVQYHSSRNPFFELADMTFGWWMVIMPPFDPPYVGEDTKTTKIRWNVPPAIAGVNPFQSWMGNRVVTKAISNKEMFRDRAVVREYAIHLPVPGRKIRYRILNASRQVVGRGQGVTDLHGSVTATNVGKDAVAVQVMYGRTTLLTPIYDY